MYRVTALTAFLAGLLSPVVATAQVNTASYVSQGFVPQICAVELPRLLVDAQLTNVEGFGGSAVLIARLTDPETLSTNAAAFGVGFEAVCNYPHVLAIESQNNGLWRDATTPVPEGFADGVSYIASVEWGDENMTFQADATTRGLNELSVPVERPTQGTIELRVEILPGATNAQAFAPLLAGIYRDIIRVTVAPQ